MKHPSPADWLQPIEPLIRECRAQKVILDADLARLYGVQTGALNRAVQRNRDRFPEDFVFELSATETDSLRCQSGISKGRGGRRSLPFVFTEHGAIMAANVLRSPGAVQMSVFVVRAFVRMRAQLVTSDTILRRLAEIDRALVEHDAALQTIWKELQPLLLPPPAPPRRKIGFEVQEALGRYRVRRKRTQA